MKFKNKKSAAKFMIKLGKKLQKSNVPISAFISRKDNNSNWELGYKLIAVGERIKDGYKDLNYE